MTRRKDPRPDASAPAAEPVLSPDALPAAPASEPLPGDASSFPPPDPDPQPDVVPAKRQSGFFGLLLGGALAAGGGYAVSQYGLAGADHSDTASGLATLSARLDEAVAKDAASLDKLSGQIAGIESRLTALETAPLPAAADPTRLDALEARLSAIETLPSDGSASDAALAAKVADLDRRLAALPVAKSSAEVQQQLDAALARLETAETAAKARATEAEAAASANRRAQALDALSAAIAEGRPFTDELSRLDDPALSGALAGLAETGVPTLAALQASFPDPAREALRIARAANAAEGWSDRLVDFLAAQTEARSLTPQTGAGPDAILSRAEFALSEGRVTDALAELDGLAPAAKAPLASWIAAATSHVSAGLALQTARGK